MRHLWLVALVAAFPGAVGAANREAQTLSPEDLWSVASTGKPAYDKCREESEKHEPKLRAKLIIRWKVETSGKVQTPQVEPAELKDTRFAKCVIEVIKVLQYPRLKSPAEAGFSFDVGRAPPRDAGH